MAPMAAHISPTAFKQHITQLLSDFTRCDELCDSIFTNRRTGRKHESLDRLQQGFKSAAKNVSIKFNALQRVFGSRWDLGDDTARRAAKANIREIELDMERKLDDIANRRDDGLPGFKEMLKRVERIEEDVLDTLEALAQRLERPVEKKPETPKPTAKPKKQDEVVINLKELAKYTDHLKNSWAETVVKGKILYVNCWDETKNQWERPDGFIKALPKSSRPVREVIYDESPRRRARADSWERTSAGSGW